MNDKHYLSELPTEELKRYVFYPSPIWNELYDFCAEDNSLYQEELTKEILGKDYNSYVEIDYCSYTWWANIKPGRYADTLDITAYDYFNTADADTIKKLQKKITELKDKVENLDGDDPEYYDKIAEWEDQADELADEIIQVVVTMLKEVEEVTDEQILDTFQGNDMGNQYYYLGNDKSKVYKDYTKTYDIKGAQ